MKKNSNRSSLSQGVLSITTKDAGRNISKHGNCAASLIEEEENVNGTNITPRITTPSKSVSVEHPTALTELSISDVEMNEKNEKLTPQKVRQNEAQVLVTETSNVNGITGGEVETRSFKTQSPARVICHSPSSYEGIVPNSLVDTSQPTPVSLDGECGDTFVKEPRKVKTTKSGTATTKKTKASVKKKKYLPVESRYKTSSARDNSLEFSVISPQKNAKPQRSTFKAKGRVHSTPYLTNSTYLNAPTDGSILDTTAFQARALEAENVLKKKSSKKFANKDSSTDSKNTRVKDSDGVSQLQLDLQYARNMQMAYMSMKTKETFQKQKEKAETQLYGLWTINRKLEEEVQTLKNTVAEKELEIATDRLLGAQVECLGMIENKFSKVVVNTSKLSDALNNASHYLPVKDVIIDEGKLLKSLDESKKLIGEITTVTRINQPEIEELAKTLGVLKETLSSELSEQKLCAELLTTCNLLANHERSLQVQVIQVVSNV